MIIKIVDKLSNKEDGSNSVIYFEFKEISNIHVSNPKKPDCAFINITLKNGVARTLVRDTFEEANKVVEDLYVRVKSGPHIYSIDLRA